MSLCSDHLNTFECSTLIKIMLNVRKPSMTGGQWDKQLSLVSKNTHMYCNYKYRNFASIKAI